MKKGTSVGSIHNEEQPRISVDSQDRMLRRPSRWLTATCRLKACNDSTVTPQQRLYRSHETAHPDCATATQHADSTVQGRYVPLRYFPVRFMPLRYVPIRYFLAVLRVRTFHP